MKDHINSDTEVKTDFWSGYNGMEVHFPKLSREKSGKKGENFKHMHRVIMMFKVGLRGTHHSVMNLQPYINEYTYRFNRQKMKEGIFENLMNRIVVKPPYPYKEFIKCLIRLIYPRYQPIKPIVMKIAKIRKLVKKPLSTVFMATALIVGMGCMIENLPPNNPKAESPFLKDLFEGKFHIGTAMNGRQITGRDENGLELIKTHFNSIVAENVMKSGPMQPNEGDFQFDMSDQFVEFGEKHGMHIIGHTLIWHSQAPKWFFTDENGNDVSKEVLKERMETHIKTVVGRYKGRVHGWDVVNEAVLDDGSYRESKFYQILGEEFIHLAFQMAHKADPDAELYYNDYSMANPGKREGVVKMVKGMQDKGIKIDAIGMQGHVGMGHPSLEEFEKSIEAFADLGVSVMITELDLSVLPSPRGDAGAELTDTEAYQEKLNPYTEGLPEEVEAAFTDRYLDFFKLFLKHEDKISRVTTWGVADHHSWKNNWPVRGRTDYPLLFDREYQAKPIVQELAKLVGYH